MCVRLVFLHCRSSRQVASLVAKGMHRLASPVPNGKLKARRHAVMIIIRPCRYIARLFEGYCFVLHMKGL